MPNEEQIAYWNGPGGAHWVAEQDRYDRLVGGFGARVVAAAGPQPGETVLDIGCGNGALTLACAGGVGPAGRVVGVDISGPMLATARARAAAAGLDRVSFEEGDAQVHDFDPTTFDLAVSRFGVMFFDDPVKAFANVAGALRPGGRLAFVCWRTLPENDWLMVPVAAALQYVPMPELGEPGAPGPFAFADPDHVREILTGGGFDAPVIEPVEEPMPMGLDVDDVVAFAKSTEMSEILMSEVDEATAAKAWDAVAAAFAEHVGPDGITLTGRAWLVTATRG